MDISYIINELAEDRSTYFNSVAPPLMQSSNFAYETVDGFRKAFENEYGGYLYSRGLNPTTDILRKKLAALDNAEDCLLFGSGAAATFAGVLANVKSGDHIVSVKNPYSWTQKLFDHLLPRFGITTTYVDGREIDNFERAIFPNTRLIYLESPCSWDYALQDLKAVADLATAEDIITIIDNSYCTGIHQRPIDLGIDLVMQTATKYISGHSDTLGGVLCGKKDMIERIFNSEFMTIGSGMSPFNAWLLLRGLRTLPMRLETITRSTNELFNYLKNHPKVELVIFPFDPEFPQYELAKRQMTGACGLLTFAIKADTVQQVELFCESLQHILMAVSWGGHESLIVPKCAGMKREDFDAGNPEHRLIRLYVGLEEPAYLIGDLDQAFGRLQA